MIVSSSRLQYVAPSVSSDIGPWSRELYRLISPVPMYVMRGPCVCILVYRSTGLWTEGCWRPISPVRLLRTLKSESDAVSNAVIWKRVSGDWIQGSGTLDQKRSNVYTTIEREGWGENPYPQVCKVAFFCRLFISFGCRVAHLSAFVPVPIAQVAIFLISRSRDAGSGPPIDTQSPSDP